MSALATKTAACLRSAEHELAAPMVNSFQAWRINPHRTDANAPVTGAGTTLESFAESVAVQCDHKAQFLIAETVAGSGKTLLHSYVVKRKSTPRYVREGSTYNRVHDLYSERVFSIAVEAFQPVEPWAWSPGADVVGHDAGLVEVSA